MKGKIEKFEGEKYKIGGKYKLANSYTIKYYCKYGLMTPLRIYEEDMAEFMDDITTDWMLKDDRMKAVEEECIKRYHERKAFEEHERFEAYQRGYKEGHAHGLAQRKLEDKLEEEKGGNETEKFFELLINYYMGNISKMKLAEILELKFSKLKICLLELERRIILDSFKLKADYISDIRKSEVTKKEK